MRRKPVQPIPQVERAPQFFEVRDLSVVKKIADELNNPGAAVVIELSRLNEKQQQFVQGYMSGAAHILGASVEQVTETRFSYKNPS